MTIRKGNKTHPQPLPLREGSNYHLEKNMLMTYNIQNDFGLEDPGFALLREVAQRYCPEELQRLRQAAVPDEVLNLAAIELLTPPLTPPLQGRGTPAASGVTSLPSRSGGVGGGLHLESLEQGLSTLHYEEADTLNTEQIKKDFPVLRQKVNGHDQFPS